jgi:predicted DNA binding CopG/RHH family protein
MSDLQLDQEERELLESYERDEWEPVPDQEAEIGRYRAYAEATFRKDRRVNIRISSKDLEALQTIALQEGIPYQTLIASVLHKYVSGRLLERPRHLVQVTES